MTQTTTEAPSAVEVKLAELGVRVEDLRSTEGWVRYLEVARKFHRYSFRNQLLIMVQRPDATHVAGYRAWQGMGRQVLKGERSLKILAPVTRKDDDGTKRVVGFKGASVFDIAQTSGDPLPEHPGWPVATGTATDADLAALIGLVEEHGLGVEMVSDEEPPVDARGWYVRSEGRIFLRESASSVEAISTLLHELGHHFDPGLDVGTRPDKEHVAECVAYLAAPAFGVDKEACTLSYLVSWQGDSKALLAVGHRVQKAYAALCQMLEGGGDGHGEDGGGEGVVDGSGGGDER